MDPLPELIPYNVRLYNEGSKAYLDDELSQFCQANGGDWCTVVAIPKLNPTNSSNPSSPSKSHVPSNTGDPRSPSQSLQSSPMKTHSVVSERVHEYVQKIGDYEYHTDNGSSVVNGEAEGRSVQDRADEIISLDDNSSGADGDVEILELESDSCEILCVAVHNFQMDESTMETFYALLYFDGSNPDESELPLAYISVDFAKRVLKTLKKPIHRMRANKWFQGLKTQTFKSLADQFQDINQPDIELVADVINKRPNIHFEPSSHILELRDIQVSFTYIYYDDICNTTLIFRITMTRLKRTNCHGSNIQTLKISFRN